MDSNKTSTSTATLSPPRRAIDSTDQARPKQQTVLGRLGAFCARRRWYVVAAWTVLFVFGMVVGSQVFVHLKDSNGASTAESVQGFEIADKVSTHGGSMVAVIDGPAVDDPATRWAVTSAALRVSQVTGVTGVTTTYNNQDPRLRSTDGRASLLVIVTAKTTDMAVANQEVSDVRKALANSVPGATIKVGGGLGVMHDQMLTTSSDLVRGEAIAIPILLIALLFVFRGCARSPHPHPGCAGHRRGRTPAAARRHQDRRRRVTPSTWSPCSASRSRSTTAC